MALALKVDELLQVRALFLLFGPGGLLQGQLLGAQFFKGAVAAAVAGELAVFDVQRGLRDGVQKVAVVADDDERAGVARQPSFQPHQRVQVQVVGGFVQQQQIRRGHERARQLQPHAPAARKAVDGLLQLAGFEAQPEDERLRARRGVVRAGVLQIGMQLGDGHAFACRFGLRQLGAQACQAFIARQHKGGGRFAGFGHVLRHLRDAPVGGHGKVAPVFMQRAAQQRKQGGFARAIAAHQGHFFAGVNGGAGSVEQHFGATAQSQVLKRNHV